MIEIQVELFFRNQLEKNTKEFTKKILYERNYCAM